MTLRQIRCGIACCGECGAHLVIKCSGGCQDFEPEFQKDRSLNARQTKPKKEKPTHCTYPGCFDPIAPREKKTGRPASMCIKHREKGRQYHRKAI